jgi:NAD(P)H dehydrogenase (quinone)
MLIVTGATGQLGGLVLDHLLKLVEADQIGVSVRDPEKALVLANKGVRVRKGDYSDAESLQHAWEGAERLLLISSNAAASGGDPLAQHRTAIEVARAVGVKRIFYTSQIASSAQSHFPPARDHFATEQMLAASGLAWTSLRHGFYAASGQLMNARGFVAGLLEAPVDGKISWTTHDDLAAADAALLAGSEEIDGPTPPLTASEPLDLDDLAMIATALLGRRVTRQLIGDEQMRVRAQERGVPETAIDFMLGYFVAARAGEFLSVDPTLERLIGRPPQSMREYLAKTMR